MDTALYQQAVAALRTVPAQTAVFRVRVTGLWGGASTAEYHRLGSDSAGEHEAQAGESQSSGHTRGAATPSEQCYAAGPDSDGLPGADLWADAEAVIGQPDGDDHRGSAPASEPHGSHPGDGPDDEGAPGADLHGGTDETGTQPTDGADPGEGVPPGSRDDTPLRALMQTRQLRPSYGPMWRPSLPSQTMGPALLRARRPSRGAARRTLHCGGSAA